MRLGGRRARGASAHEVGARLRLSVLEAGAPAAGVALDHDGTVPGIGEQPRHRFVEAGNALSPSVTRPAPSVEQVLRLDPSLGGQQLAVLVAGELVEVVEAAGGEEAAEGPAPLERLGVLSDVPHRVLAMGDALYGCYLRVGEPASPATTPSDNSRRRAILKDASRISNVRPKRRRQDCANEPISCGGHGAARNSAPRLGAGLSRGGLTDCPRSRDQ